jgi:cytochrome c oxidase subunit II
MKFNGARVASTLLPLFLTIVLSPLGFAKPQEQSAQVIDMNAKKYEFSPSPLHVKKGQKIQLRITATDHDHGFKISGFPEGAEGKGAPGLVFSSDADCWKIKKGESVTIEFVAQTPGTYTFKCCVDCGVGHRRMKGELVVDE